jgi:hypothetical protein
MSHYKKRILFGGALVMLACFLACRSQDRGSVEENDVCVRHLRQIRDLLEESVANGMRYPKSLSTLSSLTTNASLFVCCGETDASIGSMANVEEWTDFIYVANLTDFQDQNVAMVISPPENHYHKHGYATFLNGQVLKLPPNQIRALIGTPWLMATNATTDDILEMKRHVKVVVPKRFRADYGR